MGKNNRNRGGRRRRSAPLQPSRKSAQATLITEIIRHFGGRKGITTHLKNGIDAQSFINWRIRGKVPVFRVQEIAKALDISPFALNYNEMKKISSEKAPAWKEVIEKIPFLSPESKKRILLAGEP